MNPSQHHLDALSTDHAATPLKDKKNHTILLEDNRYQAYLSIKSSETRPPSDVGAWLDLSVAHDTLASTRFSWLIDHSKNDGDVELTRLTNSKELTKLLVKREEDYDKRSDGTWTRKKREDIDESQFQNDVASLYGSLRSEVGSLDQYVREQPTTDDATLCEYDIGGVSTALNGQSWGVPADGDADDSTGDASSSVPKAYRLRFWGAK